MCGHPGSDGAGTDDAPGRTSGCCPLFFSAPPAGRLAGPWVSHRVAFFLATHNTPGVIVEQGTTQDIFNNPVDARTSDYVHGRFG